MKGNIPHKKYSIKPRDKRYVYETLQGKEAQERYIERVERELGMKEQGKNSKQEWEKIEASIKNAREGVVQESKTAKSKEWYDAECSSVIEERRKAREEMLGKNTEANREKYKLRRREVKNICRRKKRTHYENKIKDIEERFKNKEIRNFYQEVRKEKRGFQSKQIYYKDKEGNLIGEEEKIGERWKEFFEDLLNKSTEEAEQREKLRNEEEGEDVYPPTENEFRELVKNLKNHKSAGENGVVAELIKYGGDELRKRLYELIVEVWNSEEMPEEWAKAVIIPLHKKGDRTVCDNYRGIALLDTVYKILAHCIRTKLNPYAERAVGEYQSGFRSGRSVTDQIFSLKQIQSKCYEYKIPLYTVFIDFKQAYDSIARNELYKAMEDLKVPHKLIRLIRMTMEQTKGSVRINGNVSDEFKIENGLRQGDPLSTALFNLALEKVIRGSGINRQGTIYHNTHQCLAYADDLTIIATTEKHLKKVVRNLEKTARIIGLRINEQKSKFMIMGSTRNEEKGKDLIIRTENGREYKFERVDSFTYLGVTIAEDNNNSKEIQARILKGNKTIGAVSVLLNSKNLTKNAKKRIYKTVIRPTVTYASETWTLNKRDVQNLECWERKVLRKIYGGKKVGEMWTRRTNDEINELYSEANIIKIVKAQQLRWLGHVERLQHDRVTKMVLRGGPLGVKRRGRPRKRWLETVEEDIKVMGIRDWRTVAKDRSKWRKTIHQALGL